MVGKTVLAYTGTNEPGEPPRTALEVATAVCFVVGIMQLIMCVCRLGVISFLLSDTLVSGFTTGAAIHVVTSQIKDLLGLTLPSVGSMFEIVKVSIPKWRESYLCTNVLDSCINKLGLVLGVLQAACSPSAKMLYTLRVQNNTLLIRSLSPSLAVHSHPQQTYIEIFKQIVNVNWAAIIISTITIVVLVFNNEILKVREYCQFAIRLRPKDVKFGSLHARYATVHLEQLAITICQSILTESVCVCLFACLKLFRFPPSRGSLSAVSFRYRSS